MNSPSPAPDNELHKPGLVRKHYVLLVARQRNYRRLFLETGSHPAFLPAQALYRSVGFRECGPFGAYQENGFSVFMSLRLDGEHAADGRAGGEPG